MGCLGGLREGTIRLATKNANGSMDGWETMTVMKNLGRGVDTG